MQVQKRLNKYIVEVTGEAYQDDSGDENKTARSAQPDPVPSPIEEEEFEEEPRFKAEAGRQGIEEEAHVATLARLEGFRR